MSFFEGNQLLLQPQGDKSIFNSGGSGEKTKKIKPRKHPLLIHVGALLLWVMLLIVVVAAFWLIYNNPTMWTYPHIENITSGNPVIIMPTATDINHTNLWLGFVIGLGTMALIFDILMAFEKIVKYEKRTREASP